MKFALMMEKTQIDGSNTFQIQMKTHNTGIPDAEVYFLVRAWLEKLEETMKKNVKDGIQFG